MNGIIEELLLTDTRGGALLSSKTVELEPGKGIVGDRYYFSQGTFSKKLKGLPDAEVTLIEQEEIDNFNNKTGLNYAGKDFRRNIVTRGVRLNELIEKEFYIGKMKLKGIRLCEPCDYLSRILGPEIMQHMIHKSGLRAQIIVGGKIHVSDSISR